MQGMWVQFLVQELRFHMPCSQKTKQNTKQTQYCSKINKDFKNGPHQKDLLKKSSIRDENTNMHPDINKDVFIYMPPDWMCVGLSTHRQQKQYFLILRESEYFGSGVGCEEKS